MVDLPNMRMPASAMVRSSRRRDAMRAVSYNGVRVSMPCDS